MRRVPQVVAMVWSGGSILVARSTVNVLSLKTHAPYISQQVVFLMGEHIIPSRALHGECPLHENLRPAVCSFFFLVDEISRGRRELVQEQVHRVTT